jgi:hypothetical protein
MYLDGGIPCGGNSSWRHRLPTEAEWANVVPLVGDQAAATHGSANTHRGEADTYQGEGMLTLDLTSEEVRFF